MLHSCSVYWKTAAFFQYKVIIMIIIGVVVVMMMMMMMMVIINLMGNFASTHFQHTRYTERSARMIGNDLLLVCPGLRNVGLERCNNTEMSRKNRIRIGNPDICIKYDMRNGYRRTHVRIAFLPVQEQFQITRKSKWPHIYCSDIWHFIKCLPFCSNGSHAVTVIYLKANFV